MWYLRKGVGYCLLQNCPSCISHGRNRWWVLSKFTANQKLEASDTSVQTKEKVSGRSKKSVAEGSSYSETVILGSLMTDFTCSRTSSTVSPVTILKLIEAEACWGSTLSFTPALKTVGAVVVLIVAVVDACKHYISIILLHACTITSCLYRTRFYLSSIS